MLRVIMPSMLSGIMSCFVTMPSVILLIDILQSVVMQSVVMQSVVMLSVVLKRRYA
jgi:hypothetical protein